MAKTIHLYGDSILDNASYVDEGRAVTDHMRRILPVTSSHELYAVDGHTTNNCLDQIKSINPSHREDKDIIAILSIGGNDALQSAGVLFTPVESVAAAFKRMMPMIQSFRQRYEEVIRSLVSSYHTIRVCTIYNKIPGEVFGIGEVEMMALSLYNDVITELADKYGIAVIDLRNICNLPSCYSSISPIEPSDEGGERIARAICKSLDITV